MSRPSEAFNNSPMRLTHGFHCVGAAGESAEEESSNTKNEDKIYERMRLFLPSKLISSSTNHPVH